jgi:hypothetical protein
MCINLINPSNSSIRRRTRKARARYCPWTLDPSPAVRAKGSTAGHSSSLSRQQASTYVQSDSNVTKRDKTVSVTTRLLSCLVGVHLARSVVLTGRVGDIKKEKKKKKKRKRKKEEYRCLYTSSFVNNFIEL